MCYCVPEILIYLIVDVYLAPKHISKYVKIFNA